MFGCSTHEVHMCTSFGFLRKRSCLLMFVSLFFFSHRWNVVKQNIDYLDRVVRETDCDFKARWETGGTTIPHLCFPLDGCCRASRFGPLKKEGDGSHTSLSLRLLQRLLQLGGVRTQMQKLLSHKPINPGPGASTNYRNNGAKFNQNQQKAGAQLTR